jgi:hypothetical protein
LAKLSHKKEKEKIFKFLTREILKIPKFSQFLCHKILSQTLMALLICMYFNKFSLHGCAAHHNGGRGGENKIKNFISNCTDNYFSPLSSNFSHPK